ncbi:hypothetical protein PSCICP_50720 [Pseudomonas cichorii]|uniref:Uncharacterized protein n=1 Tax=Pseudomonas cichorii TaxID=36746 RepID=A0ABQ1DVP6_PSECI|nr:hypothetical protein PSCICP_50720 [Pseudomonas cichorii]
MCKLLKHIRNANALTSGRDYGPHFVKDYVASYVNLYVPFLYSEHPLV